MKKIPTAESLHRDAANFAAHTTDATPESRARFAAAVLNGRVFVQIEITPNPGIEIVVDPGEPAHIELTANL